MGLLSGRVAIVTGSTRGIGLEVARAFKAEGAAVVLNGRDEHTLETAMRELGCAGVAGSAADPKVASALVRAAGTLGTLGVLVNCTGTAEPVGSSILTVTSSEWHELLDAHLNATFEMCRAAAPVMVAAGRGAIVNTSSHAFTGIFGGTGYAAGKGAVNSLTYALAAELREHGVRVNAVCPGAETRLSTGADYTKTIEDLHRRGLLDELMHTGALNPPPAEYVAPLYTFLASDLAEGISGEVFVGAGGYLGRFEPPSERFVTYRDHATASPWSPREIAQVLGTTQPD